ncbi:MAG: carbon storage regulator [Promethearchaeota archaeon]|jgi:carbon storage regulator
MLVLSRQREESVIIGEGENAVRVRVVDIRGDKVRLGFEAPRSIQIHREEVYNKIHAQELAMTED